MKIKSLFLCMMALLMSLATSCKEDELSIADSEALKSLSVKGTLSEDGFITEYASVLDESNGTIIVQVPYYLSDTEPIQGDISQMKVVATLPAGARFDPAIGGIHDLEKGYSTNLVRIDGTKTPFTIKAEYKKSNAAAITNFSSVSMPNMTVNIVNPEGTEGGAGDLKVYKTSGSIEAAMSEAILTASPWSTVECKGYNAETQTYDLSTLPEVVVTAQDGVTKTVYTLSYETPKTVAYGVGYITNLFGLQLYKDNEEGFIQDKNESMAVINDYLIIGNKEDLAQSVVMNRFSGKKVNNVTINTSGVATGRTYVIANDDNNHLVAVTYVSSRDDDATSDKRVLGYVWKDGLDSKPSCFLEANLEGSAWKNAPYGVNSATKISMFRTLSVKGDMTSGEALIATASMEVPRPVFLHVKDGQAQYPAKIEWAGGTVSMWKATKVSLLSNTAPYAYTWATSNYRSVMHYIPATTTANRAVQFDAPTSHWWGVSGYQRTARSGAAIDFNGARIYAVCNTNYAGQAATNGTLLMYGRLFVSDITSGAASALNDGFIFDSREGNKLGTAGISGTGYGEKGMTSPISYVSGKTVLGQNLNEMADVVWGKSSDGNSVQVYMLVPNEGLIAYELTRYDM